MPELPEVEVVRRGLADWAAGRTVTRIDVYHPRAVRRHVAGPVDFARRQTGLRLEPPRRRGKYLWLPLARPDSAEPPADALLAHLGMSGQLLLRSAGEPDEKHLRVRYVFDDDGPELRFADQRTFGHLMVAPLAPAVVGSEPVPEPIAHIAADPMEDAFDVDAFHAALRRRRTELKRALLDQSLISGVGNIYADEALWRARMHGGRLTANLTRPETGRLVAAIRGVMALALDQGGTSFDSLYVNVNGESGYFDRSLEAYGRRDEPCRRCGTPIRRVTFMNRSSYFCPVCQPVPRSRRPRGAHQADAW
ncbi:MAG: bifunctional DNA-formamidopyrimidine glycosylase/DNA-(apurinic or apyrimidinic site) lyase [Streptosporangiales bacterium]|nr:bifunctional DNA-formamidopyrimidine glycosylase/DNA-(apurinic or apyrimidinic site) lyase [Streptosporangiales bacterium]